MKIPPPRMPDATFDIKHLEHHLTGATRHLRNLETQLYALYATNPKLFDSKPQNWSTGRKIAFANGLVKLWENQNQNNAGS